MTDVTYIELGRLALSPQNVRKVTPSGIAELAESIAKEGLLQNLAVVKTDQLRGADFLVVAGGRRLRALQLLHERGEIAGDFPVACRIVDQEAAEAVSLAENQMREAMHPVDQLLAFTARVDAGDSVTDVASRFGVTEAFVKQRLKLSTVAPALLEKCREGEITIEQLQAFSVTSDHARQVALWEEVKDQYWNSDPSDIKRELLEDVVDSRDRRLKFIGKAAYLKAGGAIISPDLFADEDDRDVEAVSDPDLLDRLVMAKLQRQADKLKKAEKLAFVEVMPEPLNFRTDTDFVRATITHKEATPELLKAMEDLEKEIEDLCQKQDQAAEAEDWEKHDELVALESQCQEQLDGLGESLEQPHPDEIEHLGAAVFVDFGGKLQIVRNIIRKEHQAKVAIVKGPTGSAASESQEQSPAHYSERLVRMMTGHKTAILRNQVLGDGPEALVVLLAHMLSEDYGNEIGLHCHPLSTTKDWRMNNVEENAPDVVGALAYEQFNARQDEILGEIKAGLQDVQGNRFHALCDYLKGLLITEQLDILSLCVANRLDVISGHYASTGKADLVAQRVLNDKVTARYWQPVKEAFLDHVSKAQIVEAVSEAAGPSDEALRLASLKRGEAADKAEKMLDGTGWLPSTMRTAREA